jgi:peptidyl-prolyl cis-trans isomerase SurA
MIAFWKSKIMAAAVAGFAVAAPVAAALGVVAVVNGEAISTLQLEQRIAQFERRLAKAQQPVPPRAELAEEALHSLISERLQLQAAKRLGISVGEAEVDDTVAMIAARNRLDERGLREALAKDGLTWERFRAEVRQQLLVQRLRDRVTQGSDTVSESEIDHFIAAFPDLKRRFAEEASGVVQTQVRHILLKTKPTLSDEAAEARLKALKERVARGESFEVLARTHSEDGSAANGGLIGWVLPGDLVPEFEQVMNRLEPNALSDPVKTRFGWHLIQVVARRPLIDDPEAFRRYAANQLRERKRNQAFEAFLQSLEAEAVIERPQQRQG